ncbi:ferric reductase like transmembrane component-domain-containing protein [Xylariales sp. PMI_506]|nr:ferric reductase like transmembrane component-domain-containing protein [Xylariales sp. PMI_506]
MTLGPHPYYWPNTSTVSYGGSPPIATRSGWMALACLPFMLILATKANMIAALTGVSHERLMVFHSWVGWAMFVLALVHTFPFVVLHIQKGDIVTQWNTEVTYWTGVAAIIPQAYLQVMSLPFIRNRFYEFFKATHFLAAAVLLSSFFFIATFDFHLAYSQIRAYFEYGFQRARLEMVSESTLKVTIPINTTWRPGQHMFLRFITLGAHSLTAHPFTICSVPIPRKAPGSTEMWFYIRPRGGLTGRLAALATKSPGITVLVLLDGPYGVVKEETSSSYDRSLAVTCGSGAAMSLGLIMDAILRSKRYSKDASGKRHGCTRVIIATRETSLVGWFEQALVEFLEATESLWPADDISISIYQTRGTINTSSLPTQSERQDEEKQGAVSSTTSSLIPINIQSGRPDVRAIIQEASAEIDVSLDIVACGPAALIREVQDEAAAVQMRILSSKPGAREVHLNSELFS